MTELGLSAAEHVQLNGFMVDIASEARGTPVADAAGNHRFGGKGSLCIYASGQFHDFSGGEREHGHNALELISASLSERRRGPMGSRVACLPSRPRHLHP